MEERRYRDALEEPEAKAALHGYECAQARRDSVSRKLCGGSSRVTVSDLAHCESALSEAKELLVQIATRSPLLARHQILAGAVGHG